MSRADMTEVRSAGPHGAASPNMVELRTLDRRLLCKLSRDGRRLEIVQRGMRYEVDLVAVWVNAESMFFVMDEETASDAREEGEGRHG